MHDLAEQPNDYTVSVYPSDPVEQHAGGFLLERRDDERLHVIGVEIYPARSSIEVRMFGAPIAKGDEATEASKSTQPSSRYLNEIVRITRTSCKLNVEFANRRQASGLAQAAALREASLTRLRPVLITSAATVFGHLPPVRVSRPGTADRNSIGAVPVAGMLVGTLFTLFVVPVFDSPSAARHRPSPARDGIEHEARPGLQAAPAMRTDDESMLADRGSHAPLRRTAGLRERRTT